MKKGPFSHLFVDDKTKGNPSSDPMAKKALFFFFLAFFILYLQYKPYETIGDTIRIEGLFQTLFYYYKFIISQTLGIVHEGGHGVCYLFGCPHFITALNGTVFQWLFPLGIAYYYRKRGNQMVFYTGLFILAISMDYTAWYMSTAHEGAFVPASRSFLGVDGYHDFNTVFSALGVLEYDGWISWITRFFSKILMFGSMIGMFLQAFGNEKGR